MTDARQVARERAEDVCEARLDCCWGRGSHAHHKLPRRFQDHSPDNLLWVCTPCHQWIHAHPQQSYTLGWLVRGNGRKVYDWAEEPG